ncbi:MAG: sialidase family protein [Chloroflexota bacterium]
MAAPSTLTKAICCGALPLLIVFAPTAAARRSPPITSIRVSGPDPYASCPLATSLGSTEYPGSAVQPSVAIDPTTEINGRVTLVGVWQQDRWSDGGSQGIVAARSDDGGLSWRETALPFSRCAAGGGPFNRASDSWISIGPDGLVYASAVAASAAPGEASATLDGVEVAVSRDAGRTWSEAQILPGSVNHGDGARILVDPSSPGVAYAVWGKAFQPRSGGLAFTAAVSRTGDGGKTWSAPHDVVLRSPGHRDGGSIYLAISPHGQMLYDVTPVFRTVHAHGAVHVHELIGETTSRDHGRTWSPTHFIARVRLPTVFPPVRAMEHVQATIDPVSGHLYVVWEDARFSGGTYAGLAISSSKNGGGTWSTPQEIPSPAGDEIFGPSLAVTTGGAVGVAYYTLPQSAGKPLSAPTQYWLSISHDHARHFDQPTPLGGPFDPKRAPLNGSFLGDYQGLAAGASFYPFFAMANPPGIVNSTDVFASAISP